MHSPSERPGTPELTPREIEARRLRVEASGAFFAPAADRACVRGERVQKVEAYVEEGLKKFDKQQAENSSAQGPK